jgi:hypothetical protein
VRRDELGGAVSAGVVDQETNLLSARLWPIDRVRVPGDLVLEDSRLYWSDAAFEEREGDPTGALDRFRRLHNGAGVLRFAQRYGVLGLCHDGLPTSHYHGPGWCPPSSENGRRYEPIDRWLDYARQARAMVELAIALRRHRPGDDTDWRLLLESEEAVGKVHRYPGMEYMHLQGEIDHWIYLAGVRPGLYWDEPKQLPELRLVGNHTFGVLAAQLLLAVTGAHGWAICSWCGDQYEPTRAPVVGRANFCHSCVEKAVPERLRKRRQRARARSD